MHTVTINIMKIKKQRLITIGLLLFMSGVLISCAKIEKRTYKFNGIYRTHPDGREFSLIGDKEKTIKIDTIPIIVPGDFDRVRMEFCTTTEKPLLSIQLTEAGKVKFAKLTRENIGKPIAIILNDKLLSMPVVHVGIPNGKIEISGLDKEMMENLVDEFTK